MAMIKKRALFLLVAGLLMGVMAVSAQAEYSDRDLYEPKHSSMSSEQQLDAWELREAMETGALPGQPVISSETVCCRGIEEPATESGATLFRPELDSGA